MEENIITIEDIFRTLKRRWVLIVITTLITTIVAAALSLFVIKPTYEASTKVFIGKEEGVDQKYSQSDVLMYQKLIKTYSEAIKTIDFVEGALENVDTSLDSAQVLEKLNVNSIQDTQILKISFQGRDGEEAKNIVEAVTKEFIKVAKTLVVNGNIKIVETVETPTTPVSPNKVRNTAIGFILGLVIGIGIAFMLEIFDNTYKSKDELERELDIPVIGMIPFME